MFYNFKANNIKGQEISMEKYKGKVILIVNTASKCGLTPQFKELEELYKEFKDKDFEILGFPCGQFKDQELKDANEINSFCQINYGVTFTMFDKIDVNGANTHPLYKYLKNEEKGFFKSDIKWNFTKFLIDKNGNVVKRYSPTKNPKNIKTDIEKIL